MKKYDVDDEFEILFTLLYVLRDHEHVTSEGFKKCVAYVSDKITNLMDPEPKLDTLKVFKKNDSDNPVNIDEEIYFAPDDEDYEFFSESTDDILDKKSSNVVL